MKASLNDLLVTFLGPPFALPFPWASQQFDDIMFGQTWIQSPMSQCALLIRIEEVLMQNVSCCHI